MPMKSPVSNRRKFILDGRSNSNEKSPVATVMLCIVISAQACSYPGPAPRPAAFDCYTIQVLHWTDRTAQVTGLPKLPPAIRLDSVSNLSNVRVVRLPKDWKFQGQLWANWDNRLRRWWRTPADRLVFDRLDQPHDLAGDSIAVSWNSPVGSVVAFLAAVPDGYAGIGQLYPRQLARDLPPLWVYLRRLSCSDWGGARLI